MKPALEKFGFHPRPMTLQEMADYVKQERARWKEYVAVAKIPPQ